MCALLNVGEVLSQLAAQAPTAYSQQLCAVACIAHRPAQPTGSVVGRGCAVTIDHALGSHVVHELKAGMQAVLLTLYPGSGAWL